MLVLVWALLVPLPLLFSLSEVMSDNLRDASVEVGMGLEGKIDSRTGLVLSYVYPRS
jgi:hypothetical protein